MKHLYCVWIFFTIEHKNVSLLTIDGNQTQLQKRENLSHSPEAWDVFFKFSKLISSVYDLKISARGEWDHNSRNFYNDFVPDETRERFNSKTKRQLSFLRLRWSERKDKLKLCDILWNYIVAFSQPPSHPQVIQQEQENWESSSRQKKNIPFVVFVCTDRENDAVWNFVCRKIREWRIMRFRWVK